MSVLYSILQTNKHLTSKDILDYLHGEGITIPPDFKPGRDPTPKELKQVLDSFQEYKVEYAKGQHSDGTYYWQASVDRVDNQHVLINGLHYLGDENAPFHIGFQGAEFMNSILQKLAPTCGWITLITGSNLKNVMFFSPNQEQ